MAVGSTKGLTALRFQSGVAILVGSTFPGVAVAARCRLFNRHSRKHAQLESTPCNVWIFEGIVLFSPSSRREASRDAPGGDPVRAGRRCDQIVRLGCHGILLSSSEQAHGRHPQVPPWVNCVTLASHWRSVRAASGRHSAKFPPAFVQPTRLNGSPDTQV